MWEIYTDVRRSMMNGMCEVCGRSLVSGQIVGHHRNTPRRFGDHSLYNLEVRHRECEIWAHNYFEGGRLSYYSQYRDQAVLVWYDNCLPKVIAKDKLCRQLLKKEPAPWAISLIQEMYNYRQVIYKVHESRLKEERRNRKSKIITLEEVSYR